MRKLRFLFLLLFSATLFAQGIIPQGNATSIVKNPGGYWSEKWQKIPVTNDVTATPNIPNIGKLRLNPVDSILQYHNGTEWSPLAPVSVWEQKAYRKDIVVSRVINGETYMFQSLIDDNETEPLIYKYVNAWTAPPLGGTWAGAWLGSGTAGNIYTQEGFAYYCLTTNTTSPKTLTAPDWIKLGQYRGVFDGVTLYNNGDIVTDGSNIVYQSQTDLNSYALDYGIISNWRLLTKDSFTIYAWGDSLTAGTGSTGEGSYPYSLSNITGFNIVNKGVPGETSTEIRTRFEAAPETHKYPVIFWVGRNNYSDRVTVMADIAAMVAMLPHENYLICNIIKAHGEGCCPIEDLNGEIKATYPKHYVELQEYLIESYDSGQPQDVIDHADGELPWSLLSDWLHLNNKGYRKVAERLAERMNYLRQQPKMQFTNVETGVLQVSNVESGTFKPIAAVETFYLDSDNTGRINAYHRGTSTNKILSIQENSGSELRLIENGGILKIGNVSPYSSGVVNRLSHVAGTKEIVFAPIITTGYIPFTDSNNNFTQSQAYQNGSGNIGVRKTNPDTEFDVNGIIQSGSLASKTRQGSLSSSQGFFQFTNGSINIDGQIFTKQLQVGNGSVTPTSDGEIAVFESEIKVGAATLPTSAPQLQQVVTDTGNQTIDGIKTYTSPIVSTTNATTSTQVPNFGQVQNLTGWAQYSGSNYTIGAPLVINAGNTSVLANNGATSTITTQLPTGVTAFVNTTNGKITPENDGDFYVIDIRFKATSSSVDGVIDIGIDIGGAMGIIRQHTISLRKGIGVEQRVALSFPVFSGSTFVANGGEVKVTSVVGNTSIYDVTFVVDRTHKAKMGGWPLTVVVLSMAYTNVIRRRRLRKLENKAK